MERSQCQIHKTTTRCWKFCGLALVVTHTHTHNSALNSPISCLSVDPSPQHPKPQEPNQDTSDLSNKQGQAEVPDEGLPATGGGVATGYRGVESLATSVKDEGVALGDKLLADVAVHRTVREGGEENATENHETEKRRSNVRIEGRHWRIEEKGSGEDRRRARAVDLATAASSRACYQRRSFFTSRQRGRNDNARFGFTSHSINRNPHNVPAGISLEPTSLSVGYKGAKCYWVTQFRPCPSAKSTVHDHLWKRGSDLFEINAQCLKNIY